ncbi:hypothetical protein [Rhodococcus aetherivorans]|uniref:hypothetical protein n=1 Tax=Rhodococcus aetherivorans TaxID=191292 RepID=UPI0012DC92EE|nr:hypothetical protein [Rhodococcus aetherivorans]
MTAPHDSTERPTDTEQEHRAQVNRRRDAALRLPPLRCGRRDPLRSRNGRWIR